MYFVFTYCLFAILFVCLESRGALRNGLKIWFVIITLVSVLRYDYSADYVGYIDDYNEAFIIGLVEGIIFQSDVFFLVCFSAICGDFCIFRRWD